MRFDSNFVKPVQLLSECLRVISSITFLQLELAFLSFMTADRITHAPYRPAHPLPQLGASECFPGLFFACAGSLKGSWA